jgi:hypothetical protein
LVKLQAPLFHTHFGRLAQRKEILVDAPHRGCRAQFNHDDPVKSMVYAPATLAAKINKSGLASSRPHSYSQVLMDLDHRPVELANPLHFESSDIAQSSS